MLVFHDTDGHILITVEQQNLDKCVAVMEKYDQGTLKWNGKLIGNMTVSHIYNCKNYIRTRWKTTSLSQVWLDIFDAEIKARMRKIVKRR